MMVLDDVQKEKYKKHPRVLEIRFILLFNLIEREYGYNQAIKFFQGLCDAFNCNMMFLQGIINRRYEIQKNSKKNYILWRQEVIFTYTLYGESLYKIAKDHLYTNPQTLYQQMDYYDINKFCTDGWLDKFDNRVILCGEKSYRIEIVRIFEILDMFADIMVKWKGVK